jgi:hypothetical protein
MAVATPALAVEATTSGTAPAGTTITARSGGVARASMLGTAAIPSIEV